MKSTSFATCFCDFNFKRERWAEHWDFLAERAYVEEGLAPWVSLDDVAVFEAMAGKASGADMAQALSDGTRVKDASNYGCLQALATFTYKLREERPSIVQGRKPLLLSNLV